MLGDFTSLVSFIQPSLGNNFNSLLSVFHHHEKKTKPNQEYDFQYTPAVQQQRNTWPGMYPHLPKEDNSL